MQLSPLKAYDIPRYKIVEARKLIVKGTELNKVRDSLLLTTPQIDFISTVLLKGEYQTIKRYTSNNPDFIDGYVIRHDAGTSYALIQFKDKEHATLCNMKSMTFDLGNGVKGRISLVSETTKREQLCKESTLPL